MAKTDLTNKTPKETYKDLLQLGTAGTASATGLASGNYFIYDGAGIASAIALGRDRVAISPATADGMLFRVFARNGNTLFRINSDDEDILVTDNLHHATTLVKTLYVKT